MICTEDDAAVRTMSEVCGEHPRRYLGDGLLQPVEGVDYSHIPPLSLGQRTDDLTGIALSAQLKEEQVEPSEPPVWHHSNIWTGTNQLFRLDTEELDGLGGVLGHSQIQAWVH